MRKKTRVTIERDFMGSLTVYPCKRFMQTWKGMTHDNDESLLQGAYLQQSQDQECVLSAMGRTASTWLARGWNVTTYIFEDDAEGIFNCAF